MDAARGGEQSDSGADSSDEEEGAGAQRGPESTCRNLFKDVTDPEGEVNGRGKPMSRHACQTKRESTGMACTSVVKQHSLILLNTTHTPQTHFTGLPC